MSESHQIFETIVLENFCVFNVILICYSFDK